MKKIFFALLITTAFVFNQAGAYSKLLSVPDGFVSDFANLFNFSQKNFLEQKLSQFEKESGIEIALVTINSLNGETIENFAEKLFKDWGIGKKDKNNGILVLIARDDRKIRIEVGYGLEGALTDAESFKIIDQIMKPSFRQNDFFNGTNNALDTIIATLKGEFQIQKYNNKTIENNVIQSLDIFGLWLYGCLALIWLASILARSKSWWAGGVVGALIGVIITLIKGLVFSGIIAFMIFIPLGLLLDLIVSKTYKQRISEKRKIPWWAGGNFGAGTWSGGLGSGGFRGFGGGSSGGGGASGRW